MTTPIITPYSQTTTTDSWLVFSDVPVAEGETMRLFVVTAQVFADVTTSSSGWVKLQQGQSGPSSAPSMAIFCSHGGGTSLQIEGSTQSFSGHLIQFFGEDAVALSFGLNTAFNSTFPCPTMSIPYDSSVIWLAVASWIAGGGAVVTSPTGYTLYDPFVTGIRQNLAYRESSETTQTPSNFTSTSSSYGVTMTLAAFVEASPSFGFFNEVSGATTLTGSGQPKGPHSSITGTVESSTDYLVLGAVEIAASGTTAQLHTGVRVNDVEIFTGAARLRIASTYQSYLMGARWNSGTTEKALFSTAFGAFSGSATARRSSVVALKMSSSWRHAEDTSIHSNATNSAQTVLTVTDTFGAGDYIVLAFGAGGSSSTTAGGYVSLASDGVVMGEESGFATSNSADVIPFFLMGRVTLTSGSHSITLRHRNHSTVTTTVRSLTLIVVPVSEFSAEYHGELTSDFTTTSTATAISFTETLSSGHHLVLAYHPTAANSTLVNETVVVSDGTENLSESVQRVFNADVERTMNGGTVRVRNYSAGSRTFSMALTTSGGTGYLDKGTSLAVLQLPSGTTPPPASSPFYYAAIVG